MKILQLTPLYSPAISGSALLFQKLSEGLVARGHEVTLVTSNALDYRGFWERQVPVNFLPPEESIAGVKVLRLPVRRGHASRNYWRMVHYWWKFRLPGSDWLRTWYDGPLLAGIDSVAAKGDYDLVCAGHTPSMVVAYGHRISKRLAVPYLIIPGLHTDNAFNIDRGNMWHIMRSACHLCANTEFERERLGPLAARASVTGCGVDLDGFAAADGAGFRKKAGIPENAPVVLFMGAEAGHKGLLVWMDAMRSVRQTYPEAYLIIAGVKSSASDQIDRRLSDDTEMSARTVRINSFAEECKPDLVDSCDVFAHAIPGRSLLE